MKIVECVHMLYEKLASIQQTSNGSPTFDIKYKKLKDSTGPSLKNARKVAVGSASC